MAVLTKANMGPLNFPCTMKGYVSTSYDEWGSRIDAAKLLLESRTPDIGLADVWGHSPTWWERAYKIVVAELGGDRPQEKLRARPSLRSLPVGTNLCNTGNGCGDTITAYSKGGGAGFMICGSSYRVRHSVLCSLLPPSNRVSLDNM